jgi:hypothetical protein
LPASTKFTPSIRPTRPSANAKISVLIQEHLPFNASDIEQWTRDLPENFGMNHRDLMVPLKAKPKWKVCHVSVSEFNRLL